nr:flagellin [Endobacter medicaginis]
MKSAGFSVSLTQNATTAADVDLHVAGNDVVTTGASATPAANGTAVTGSAWTGSDAALANVDAAINKLGAMSVTLGAQQNQITSLQSYQSTLSDALTTGVGALTDADLSEESAKLTSLQTKQQLAIQSLSMANSQSQSILSLFR